MEVVGLPRFLYRHAQAAKHEISWLFGPCEKAITRLRQSVPARYLNS
jgi:hypothetical protein